VILVDTSVWVDHLRKGDRVLERLLEAGEVLCHPFIVGELAMGSLKNRGVLRAMQNLPKPLFAHDDEVLRFIGQRKLFGMGIGYIDAHLLTSVQITPGTLLWTRDKRLHALATTMGLASENI
jgi:predicted nucleic acid-binding protein